MEGLRPSGAGIEAPRPGHERRAISGAVSQQLRRSSSGSLAMLAAMRRASSRVSSLAADAVRLLLEIDVGERLPVGVADDEAGVRFSTARAAGSGAARAWRGRAQRLASAAGRTSGYGWLSAGSSSGSGRHRPCHCRAARWLAPVSADWGILCRLVSLQAKRTNPFFAFSYLVVNHTDLSSTNKVAGVLAPAVWARPMEIVCHHTL